ncbi:MAG: hypothetical protein IPM54_36915 [Polyangiaceae bacterium]|nr:hypothetical protein [Polyangiaceae bacterium]
MRPFFEHKRFSVGFVLAAIVSSNASSAFADDLPPPPPPPPGANTTPPPPVPSGTGVLDAPPPPPPGVNVEPPPATTSAKPPPPPPPTSTAPDEPPHLAPPPPPPGTTPAKKKKRPAQVAPPAPQSTVDSARYAEIMAKYREDEKPKKPPYTGWYGWKSLIGLAPVYGLFAVGIVTDEETIFIPAAAGAILVNPIAHWTHGNKGRGWLSFGMNFGAPMIGFYATGSGYGALAGWGLWHAFDVAVLSHASTPEPPKTALGIQSFAVVPMMDKDRKGFTIIGQF